MEIDPKSLAGSETFDIDWIHILLKSLFYAKLLKPSLSSSMLIQLAIRATYPPGAIHEVAEVCLKCGVCCNVAHSCHVMYDRRFSPRYTFVYDCLASEKGATNPNLWMCVSCHKCEETCPYEVSPVHFIEALKGEALGLDSLNPTISAEVMQILTTGFAFPLTGATERQRQALNLKPLPAKPLDELAKIAGKTGLAIRLKEAQQ